MGMQLEAEQQNGQIAAAQREIGVDVPPFGRQAHREHQRSKSCFRSTSFLSSAAKRNSGNRRKETRRATRVSGNFSTRTLLTLTDSLLNSRRSAIAFSSPVMRACRCR